MKSLALALFALAAPACTVVVPTPPAPPIPYEEGLAAWARTLAAVVDDEGRIDFADLARDPRDLEAWVGWLGAHGPRTDPGLFATREAELAYWINGYNALAMYNALRSGVLPESKVRFFWVRELAIDGRTTSLYDLENDVIRPLGEPRVHFALNCMVRSCPRLPREPFRAERLDEQLHAAAVEFLDDPRNVVVDADGRTVRFNAILDFYTRDFLDVAPSLVAYANRYRAEPLPEEARVRFLEYDWTLNRAPER